MRTTAQNRTTYIEKDDFYYSNRVFIVSSVGKEYVTGTIIDYDKDSYNSTRIRKEEFKRRFELSMIQIR